MIITPSSLLRLSTLATVIGLALILLFRALTGQLPLRGMLRETSNRKRRPETLGLARAQLLVVASLCALGLLAGPATGLASDRALGAVLTFALAVSNLIYLRSKIRSLGFPSWLRWR